MKTSEQKVLLLGATGASGRLCLDLLLADERVAEVTVLVRRSLGKQHAKLREQLFEQTYAAQASTFAVDVVLCCLGTTLKKAGSKAAFRKVDFDLCVEAATLAKQAGVATFTVVSAVGANPRSPSFYARTKGEMESALKALALPHLIVAQPSLLLGERNERRPLETVSQVLAKPLVPLLGHFGLASTPFAIAQFARALVNASLQPQQDSVRILRYPELMQLSRS